MMSFRPQRYSLGALFLCFAAAVAQPLPSASRLEYQDAGLILETGVRTGACDVVMFSPDGEYLLATGDDKVVRVWRWGEGMQTSAALRWPMFREHQGNIFAMAQSSDGRFVAVGGSGVKSGAVAVLERDRREIVHGLTAPPAEPGNLPHTIWSMAFAPSGKAAAYGTDRGSVWLWDFARSKEPGQGVRLMGRQPARPGVELNKIKLLLFWDESTLLSAAEDGLVRTWDAAKPEAGPREIYKSRWHDRGVSAATLSGDRAWLALAGQGSAALEVVSLTGKATRLLSWPQHKDHYARNMAFDRTGRWLAVALEAFSFPGGFPEVTGGVVVLFDLTEANPQARPGPTTSYYPETLAFHPQRDLLAVAGGAHHEVAVWDIIAMKRVAVSPVVGTSIWQVGLSADARKLAFRTERDRQPKHVNARASAARPFQVFDLTARSFDAPDASFAPTQTLDTLDGWRIEPHATDRYLWRVVKKDVGSFSLPLRPRDGMPRCYTFLKGSAGETRVAVGHFWGVSVYDVSVRGVRRVRLFNGHQGEAMSVAASADGKTLVSSSRDQTIIGWSLADWPSHAELGARFALRQGKVMVDSVDAGSPAWEAGLTEGDEVAMYRFNAFDFLYDADGVLSKSRQLFKQSGGATECIEQLRMPVPGMECYFRLRRKEGLFEATTTVRQRPLWRFFPMANNEWVLWRWRDYYYDASPKGDESIGWQLGNELDKTPRFYQAKQLSGQFYRPRKVAEVFQGEKAVLVEMEPPRTRLECPLTTATEKGPLVTVTAQPHGGRANQQIDRVLLWINDYKHPAPELHAPLQADGTFQARIAIPFDKLRRGPNLLTFQAYNKAGGRGEFSVEIEKKCPPVTPNLHGLFVGVGDYRAAHPPQRALKARVDAETLAAAWASLKGRPYERVEIDVLTDAEVTPDVVLERLTKLGKTVRPDDLCVFFLGGHGIDHEALMSALGTNTAALKESVLPDEFWFLCARFDATQPSKQGLRAKDIYAALANLPCRKLILLDACHSKGLNSPVRQLSADGVAPMILTACQSRESAWEDSLYALQNFEGKVHGIFSMAILEAISGDLAGADRNSDKALDAVELGDYVRARVPEILQINVAPLQAQQNVMAVQNPSYSVPALERRMRSALIQKMPAAPLK